MVGPQKWAVQQDTADANQVLESGVLLALWIYCNCIEHIWEAQLDQTNEHQCIDHTMTWTQGSKFGETRNATIVQLM